MGTAALSDRDYVHEAIDRADLIVAIGHDTIEKPPFLMGPGGPQVIHVSYTPANVEQVYFPHAEVVGDVGPSLELLADRLEGRLRNARRAAGAAREHPRAASPIAPPRTASRRRRSASCMTSGRSSRRTASWRSTTACTRSGSRATTARCVANTLLLDNALATMGAGLPSAMMAAMLYPGPPRARGVRRRRLHDEQPGDGDRGAAQAEPGRADSGGQRLRHDPLEAGSRLLPRFRA